MGYRILETINKTAELLAQEHNLDYEEVKEKLHATNAKQKEQEQTLEITETKEQVQEIQNQEQEPILEVTQEIQKDLSETIGIDKGLILSQLQRTIQTISQQEKDSYSPQEITEKCQKSLEAPLENENIREALGLMDRIEETKKKIKEAEAQGQKQEDKLELEEENKKEEKDLKKLQEELEKDLKELEKLISKFSAKDIYDLVLFIYALDDAYQQFKKDNKEIKEELQKQREAELQELTEENKMSFLKKLTYSLGEKYHKIENCVVELKEQKKLYEEINHAIEKNEDKDKVKEKLEFANKNHPHFSKYYPETIKKAQNYLNPKQQTKTQAQQQTQSNTQGRSR